MALFDYDGSSAVFTEGGEIGGKPLKDRNALKEAFVYNELSHMSRKDLKEFATSKEAKYLIENEIISYNTLERLVNDQYGDRAKDFFVCHMAKESEDERWNDLLAVRERERQLMDDLYKTYGEQAELCAKTYREDYVNSTVPNHYKTSD